MAHAPTLRAFPLTLLLCVAWAGCTLLSVLAASWALPPFVSKAGPFIAAGLLAGALVASTPRTHLVSAIVVALVSGTFWSLFAWVGHPEAPTHRILFLWVVSMPIHALSGMWAYVGMALGARVRRPSARAASVD